MQIILNHGDHIPEQIITRFPGPTIREFRIHELSDGRTVVECGDCNEPSVPAPVDLGIPMGWCVDQDGILTRRA